MNSLSAKSNIANKVRNTKLPRTKPLMPLFEVISNSIHAIAEAKNASVLANYKGRIIVKCIRNGKESILESLPEINNYPIHSFQITDNGIGLNSRNLDSFTEADSDHKIEIGGKGVGRFVCLKAFKQLSVNSIFIGEDGLHNSISFEFKPTKEGFHNFKINGAKSTSTGTTIELNEYREEYLKHLNYNIRSISEEIISHFLLYFIRRQEPLIIVRNQNGIEFNLTNLFNTEFKSDIKKAEFKVEDAEFTVYLTKSLTMQSHKIHYCAHNRSVKNESLHQRLVDLGKYSIADDDGNRFYYQAYVVGDQLDEHVDTERIGFNFPVDDDDESEDLLLGLSLAKIRREAIACIENLLIDYLSAVRENKIERYRPTIYDELPQYRTTLNHRMSEVLKLPPDLPKDKLDLELYKIQSKWQLEVKEAGQKLLEETKDITNIEEYKSRYEAFLSDFNAIGLSDLSRYVVHRKVVINLLSRFIELNANGEFENEDLIHNIFFPIRSSSDDITPDKQNLWLIDERLTYHSFMASDKSFNSINEIESDSSDRTDLLIYNNAFAFSDSNIAPHNSLTIVEFKKPMRDNYVDYDTSKNPIEQTEKYIENLLNRKIKGQNGRFVEVNEKTPFYVYIVCDITPTLEKILERREFDKTPDGKGYFKIKSKYYSAYFEVLPFEKVLIDATKRNRILFDKLNIS